MRSLLSGRLVFAFAIMHAACGSPAQPAHEGAAASASSEGTSAPGPTATPGDTHALDAYIDGFRRTSDAADPGAMEKLYAADAEIIHHGGDPEVASTRDFAADLTDGMLREVIVRGVQNDRSAVVEWVYGGAHPAGPIGVRGASLLTFGARGEVVREVRYFDYSSAMAQVVAGFHYCLPVRAPTALPTDAALVEAGPFPKVEHLLRDFLTDASGKRAIPISNQFLGEDSVSEAGTAREFARALENRSTKISTCVSASTWVACAVERAGTFAAPLDGLQPTHHTGTMHSLVVASVADDGVQSAVEYMEGWELIRTYAATTKEGFLAPEQLVDPKQCSTSSGK
jgi:hypothetical protein